MAFPTRRSPRERTASTWLLSGSFQERRSPRSRDPLLEDVHFGQDLPVPLGGPLEGGVGLGTMVETPTVTRARP